MSLRRSVLEWVETTEEVVVTEESLTPSETPTEGCDECLTLYQEQDEPYPYNGPSFVLDFPAAVGIPQRALLTLPHGLMIGRSSIPSGGIGVINQGAVVSPGMHFGPYEGEVTTKEDALASDYSWEICKGQGEYEYIDAARETHSNWMRYVKFARNEDEKNLLAVQYKGAIIFHCCRVINAGEELMVWPSGKLFAQLSEAWHHIWFMRLSAAESTVAAKSEIFICCLCQLSFTTELYLQQHAEYFHSQPEGDSTAQIITLAKPSAMAACLDADADQAAAAQVAPSAKSKTCSDRGKVFKQLCHLRRHNRCVHLNKRPYCCQMCRRSFSQASSFIRHQLTHKKHGAAKGRTTASNHSTNATDENAPQLLSDITTAATQVLVAANEAAAEKETIASENLQEIMLEGETETRNTLSEADKLPIKCPDCDKTFTDTTELNKHKITTHSILRPYVCSLCRKCFRQYCDLARHLQRHKKENEPTKKDDPSPGEANAVSHNCPDCTLSFPSEEDLQQHRQIQHSEKSPETPLPAKQEKKPATCDDQNSDPDFIPHLPTPVARAPSQRPQRPGARSKISALTKLIAPKRRSSICRKAKAGDQEAPDKKELTAANGKAVKYKWYSCSQCKMTFVEPEELDAHRCTRGLHHCGQCSASFKKIGFLKRHEVLAHAATATSNSELLGCDNCGKAFFSKSSKLEQHRRACEKYYCTSELFPCSFCQFSFTMKHLLVKHIRRHHPMEYVTQCDSLMDQLGAEEEEEDQEEQKEAGRDEDEAEREERARTCQHCAKTFASAGAQKSHVCPQQLKILYLCTDCGKGFANQYSLKQHQRIHTGEKPYSCPHCDKSFTYTGQLNVHLRTHTGEKPYLCTHCGKSFRQSGDLKRHERKHTGVRPHSCPDCCKSFSRPQSLKAHQMLHLGQRMFKCSQCGKSFSRNYHLRRHHQKMHS